MRYEEKKSETVANCFSISMKLQISSAKDNSRRKPTIAFYLLVTNRKWAKSGNNAHNLSLLARMYSVKRHE